MLKQRVLTAIVLLAGFLAALFMLPEAGWILLVVMIVTTRGFAYGMTKPAVGWFQRISASALWMPPVARCTMGW